MVLRLDDAELGRRVRARNNRANQVHRERLLNAGKRQTAVWLSAGLRERIDAESAASGESLSQIVERLLLAGLAEPARADSVDASAEAVTKPAKATKATTDNTVRNLIAHDLRDQGVSVRQIAARLAEQGYLSSVGTELSPGAIGRILKEKP